MINYFRRVSAASKILFEREGLPLDEKSRLWELIDSGDEELQISAVYILSELLENSELIELASRISPENHMSFDILVIVSCRLQKEGQEFFAQLFDSDCEYTKKLAVFAIKDFGDERFVEPCKQFALQILSNGKRPELMHYLGLTELTAEYCYFQRVDPDAEKWLLGQFFSNVEKLDYCEKLWFKRKQQIQIG